MILDWLRETGYYCPSPETVKSAQYFGLTKKTRFFFSCEEPISPFPAGVVSHPLSA